MTDRLLGIDLGGSSVRAVLADADGSLVAEESVGTDQRSARAVLVQVVDLARRVAASAGVPADAIAAAAIGVPGVLASDGGLELAPHLPPFDGVALADKLAGDLGVPVVAENDVNLAALGEHRRGLGAGRSSLAFLAVGTGVGLGIVVDDVLLRGDSGAAGEVAALPIGGDPVRHAAPLEQRLGGRALVRRYGDRLGRHSELTARDVADLAEARDPDASAVLDEQARALALTVHAVHAILDPAVVVLGGGLGLRSSVVERVTAQLGRLARRPPQVAPSALGERAGLIGAIEAAAAARAAAAIGAQR